MGVTVASTTPRGPAKPLFPAYPDLMREVSNSQVSRGSKQRIARRQRRWDDVDDAFSGLNWLASGSMSLPVPDSVHREMNSYVARCVDERGRPPSDFSSEAAASELLRSHPGYTSDSKVAPFGSADVSLPEPGPTRRVVELLPPDVAQRVVGFKQHMLRDPSELLGNESDLVQPYMDPILAADPRRYRNFVYQLRRRGVVRFTLTPKSSATCFFFL
jgi:hypothetical protein